MRSGRQRRSVADDVGQTTTRRPKPRRGTARVADRETMRGERERVLAEAFHELSQPLSTLTCLLEVTLEFGRPSRRNLEIAVQQAHSIVGQFRRLRELVNRELTSNPARTGD